MPGIDQESLRINVLKLLWRTTFVVLTTVLAMSMPFFNDVLAFLGPISFWPLTVYFPVEMYITQKHMKAFSPKWVMLHTLSFGCLLVSLAAACGSIQGVVQSLKLYRLFET